MVTYSDTTLQDINNEVNGGTAVELNCTSIKYVWKTFTVVPQTPGKEPSATTQSGMLPTGSYLGFDAPMITVSGVVDLTDSGSNRITLKLLQQFAKSGNILTLTDKYDSSVPTYRISGLTGTFPSETITTIRCMVDNFSVDTSTGDDREGRVLKYNLVLKEVS